MFSILYFWQLETEANKKLIIFCRSDTLGALWHIKNYISDSLFPEN